MPTTSRRALLRAAAWSAPVAVVAAAAPAFAQSNPNGTEALGGVFLYHEPSEGEHRILGLYGIVATQAYGIEEPVQAEHGLLSIWMPWSGLTLTSVEPAPYGQPLGIRGTWSDAVATGATAEIDGVTMYEYAPTYTGVFLLEDGTTYMTITEPFAFAFTPPEGAVIDATTTVAVLDLSGDVNGADLESRGTLLGDRQAVFVNLE